jgi:hypothetical protein
MPQKSVAKPSEAKIVVFGLDSNWRPHGAAAVTKDSSNDGFVGSGVGIFNCKKAIYCGETGGGTSRIGPSLSQRP